MTVLLRVLRLVIVLPGRALARHLNAERSRNGLGTLSSLQRGAVHVFTWTIALGLVLMAITPTG